MASGMLASVLVGAASAASRRTSWLKRNAAQPFLRGQLERFADGGL